MLSHGLTTGGLFLGIGMLYERRHTRRLAEYGGIWKQMPVFSGLYLIIVMGSAGLPGLSGFVGEFLSLFGTFNAADTFPQRLAALPAVAAPAGRDRDDRRDPRRHLPAVHVPEGVLRPARQGQERPPARRDAAREGGAPAAGGADLRARACSRGRSWPRWSRR
jgi:hypothetical protein